MFEDIDSLTERFDAALYITLQNLGPQLVNRAQLGLTPGQVFMLHFIRQENQCTVSKLAEKMEVTPSAITVMLDRLENHGFVFRTRDKSDRRVVIIQLTEAGDAALNQVLNVRNEIMKHCLTQIEPDELDSFVQTLQKLATISASMDIKAIMGLENSLEG
jgi:MarR family transcriptional regulator, organic hydroperoxide resistance regulator